MRYICAALMFIVASGCVTTIPPCDPVVVEVPVDNPGSVLPEPATPEWQTPEADPDDVRGYLRALANDLLNAWKWGAEMRHVIESHNSTIAQPD